MKNNQSVWIIGLIITFIIMAFVGVKLGSVTQGMQIRSVSLLPSNEWLVDTVVNGYGQSIISNFDDDNIKYQGASIKYPVEIKADISDNKAFYQIDNSNPKTIKKIRMVIEKGKVEKHLLYTKIIPPPECPDNPAYQIGIGSKGRILIWNTASQLLVRYCFYFDDAGVIAPISSSPSVLPTITLHVESKGVTKTVELKDKNSVSLGEIGSVTWANSPLESGSLGLISIGHQYKATHKIGSNVWKLAYANDYEGGTDSYTSVWNNVISSLQFWSNGGGNIVTWHCTDTNELEKDPVNYIARCGGDYLMSVYTPVNLKAHKLLVGLNTIRINDKNSDFIQTEKNGKDGFLVDLGNIYSASPNLVFRLNGDWVGVKYPNGEPRVIKAECKPMAFSSGNKLGIDVKVKNVGLGEGNFLITLDSCTDLMKSADVYPVPVAVGKTKTISMLASTTGASSGEGICQGRIVDTGSQKYDTWQCRYKMEEPTTCTEGKLYNTYGDKHIYKCVNGKLKLWATCPLGVTVNDNGDYVCRDKPIICNHNGVCDEGEDKYGCASDCGDNDNETKKFPVLLWIPIIGFVVGFIYGFINNGFKFDKATIMTSLVIALIFMGLGIGIALLIKLAINLIQNIVSLFKI